MSRSCSYVNGSWSHTDKRLKMSISEKYEDCKANSAQVYVVHAAIAVTIMQNARLYEFEFVSSKGTLTTLTSVH